MCTQSCCCLCWASIENKGTNFISKYICTFKYKKTFKRENVKNFHCFQFSDGFFSIFKNLSSVGLKNRKLKHCGLTKQFILSGQCKENLHTDKLAGLKGIKLQYYFLYRYMYNHDQVHVAFYSVSPYETTVNPCSKDFSR